MAPLQAGDAFPADVSFQYVPYTAESSGITACGRPQGYEASKEWANKKVVLFSIPGAFTPTCMEQHVPGYLASLPKLREQGVDVVAVVAFNDPFVMSAFAKANGVKDEMLFLTDPEAQFSAAHAWTKGPRTGRYAIVVDHGKVVYSEVEPGAGVSVSGAEAVLAKL